MNSYRPAWNCPWTSSCQFDQIYPYLRIYPSVQIYPLMSWCRHSPTIRPSPERKEMPTEIPKPPPCLRLSRKPLAEHSAHPLGSPSQSGARVRLLHNKVVSKVRMKRRKVGKLTLVDLFATLRSRDDQQVAREQAEAKRVGFHRWAWRVATRPLVALAQKPMQLCCDGSETERMQR
jgi:hypothetical protein